MQHPEETGASRVAPATTAQWGLDRVPYESDYSVSQPVTECLQAAIWLQQELFSAGIPLRFVLYAAIWQIMYKKICLKPAHSLKPCSSFSPGILQIVCGRNVEGVHTSCAFSAVGQVLYSQTFTRSTGWDTLRQTTGLQCIHFRHGPCLVAESVTAKFFEGHHDRFGLVSINQCVCWRHSAPPPTEEDTATPPHASRGHHLPRCRRHRGGQVQAQAAVVAAFQRLGHGGTIVLPCAAHTASVLL